MRMPSRIVFFVLAAVAALPSQAAIYRCEAGGSVSFSDHACAAFAPAFAPKATLTVVPAGPSIDLVAEYDARIARGKARRDVADRAWLASFSARRSEEDAIRNARVERRVIKGMTAADVVAARGEPEAIARDDGKHGDNERWTFTSGQDRETVSFHDGQVVGVRSAKAAPHRRR
jgi:hypothetical protein